MGVYLYKCYLSFLFCNSVSCMDRPISGSPKQMQRPNIQIADCLKMFGFEVIAVIELQALKPCNSIKQSTPQEDVLEESILLRQMYS